MMRLLSFIFLSIILASCSGRQAAQPREVKNIILLIGDGMGTSQVYAAMSSSKNKLNIERVQFIGFSKTYSADNYTTDSGAGGTAISTGSKTKNKSIAVDTNGVKLKTILEYAKEKGKATGMVVTSSLAHATPASFIAHQDYRYNYDKIAKDFKSGTADVLIGGGRVLFDTNSVTEYLKTNLKYDVFNSLDSAKESSSTKFVCFAADKHLPKMSEGRGDFLSNATELALSRLNTNKEGFFLMVEGSQIDWGGHHKDFNFVVTETIDFDKAVGIAFDFADKNPGTLVVVTADHETGGLALQSDSIDVKQVSGAFVNDRHTGVMVPVFAYGASAIEFSEIMENTDIFHKMMKAFGFSR